MLPVIKFSHHYCKLGRPTVESATLLQVLDVKKSELSKDFLYYDTRIVDGTNYPLKSGAYLLLIFQSVQSDLVFTTLRPAWPTAKTEYYKSKMGEMFDVVLTPNPK